MCNFDKLLFSCLHLCWSPPKLGNTCSIQACQWWRLPCCDTYPVYFDLLIMANSVRQHWTVQKTHRLSAQQSQTAKLPVICADTKEIKKTRQRSKWHQPPYCNLPQTPTRKRIHPASWCIPAEPPVLDSPPPTKAQYAAMKWQRDQEYALWLVAKMKAKRLVSLVCALRKNIRYAKNAREKVIASNETLTKNLEVLQLDLENSQKIQRT